MFSSWGLPLYRFCTYNGAVVQRPLARNGGVPVGVVAAINFWWLIADVLLIVVVVPVVLLFLNKVLRPVKEIHAYGDDILEHGVGITAQLDAVPKLVRTRELTGQAKQAAGRYASALQRLL
jgi:hypothetical protein